MADNTKPLKKSHVRGRSPASESCMVSFYPTFGEGGEIEMHYLEIEVVNAKREKVGTIALKSGESITMPFSQFEFTPTQKGGA